MASNSSGVGPRANHETEALAPFLEVAERLGLRGYSKQGSQNRLTIRGNIYVQFGDLRVDTEENHIIIEVESAGGVTNLTKYWYCLEKNLISKPIVLLHIFRQASQGDYASHLELWKFLSNRMILQFGNKFQAYLYTYRSATLRTDLKEAVQKFEQLIDQNLRQY